MKMWSLECSLALLLAVPLPAVAQAAPSLDRLGAAVEKGLEAWKVPGLALAVVRDGKVVIAKGYGVASLKTREAVTADTLFYTGSVTKSFTATLAAMMVEEGAATWDEPIRSRTPGFRMFDPVATDRATLRDLLCHRSGLPRQDFLKVNAPDHRTDLIDRIRYFQPTLEFRSGFQYSNEAVTVAGDLLARASGTTWEEMMRRRILGPLGMTRSAVTLEEMRGHGGYASPYIGETAPEEMALYDVGELRGPAGALISSASDLSKWLLLNLGKGTWNGGTIVGARALGELWVPRVPATRNAPRYPELSHQSYGLGWFIDTYRGSLRISHPGNLYGFTSIVSFLPRENIGVAVLANLNGTPLPQIIERLVYDTLLGLPPADWAGRFREEDDRLRAAQRREGEQPDPGRRPDTRPSRPLDALAGCYSSPGYGLVEVRHAGDQLQVAVRSGTFPLRHYNYDVFEFYHPVEGQSWLLAFRSGTSGEITELVIDGGPGATPIGFSRTAAQEACGKSRR